MNIRKIIGYALNLNGLATLLSLCAMVALIVSNSVQGYSLGTIAVLSSVFAVVFLVGGSVTAFIFGRQHPLTAGLKLLGLALLCVSVLEILSVRTILVSALFTWDPHNALGWSAFYSSVVATVFALASVVTLIVSGFVSKDEEKQAEITAQPQ